MQKNILIITMIVKREMTNICENYFNSKGTILFAKLFPFFRHFKYFFYGF